MQEKSMTSIYERLQALQINLPEVPPPVVDRYVPSFVPFVRTDNLIYLSGRLAKKDGKPFSGKVGQEITTAEGRQAARDVAVELLATLHGALHDLNRVKRIVRLLVLVNSAPGFTEPHEVANGASELFWKSLASAARMPAARLARRRSHSAPVWRSR
jgi:enamine deaminase RidA (YjgF/YER057c/UK114 family)